MFSEAHTKKRGRACLRDFLWKIAAVSALFIAFESPQAMARDTSCWAADGEADVDNYPQNTCVPLTEKFPESIEEVSLKKLQKVMEAPGMRLDNDGTTVIHYDSRYGSPDQNTYLTTGHGGLTGSMNFELQDGHVRLIFGELDNPDGKDWQFTWNPRYGICSDRPNTRMQTCDEMSSHVPPGDLP